MNKFVLSSNHVITLSNDVGILISPRLPQTHHYPQDIRNFTQNSSLEVRFLGLMTEKTLQACYTLLLVFPVPEIGGGEQQKQNEIELVASSEYYTQDALLCRNKELYWVDVLSVSQTVALSVGNAIPLKARVLEQAISNLSCTRAVIP